MRVPTIHLNGTPGQRLFVALSLARDAVNVARDAVRATAPNGRDYYLQPGNAIGEAEAEHRTRIAKLEAVSDELHGILIHVYEALEEQKARK